MDLSIDFTLLLSLIAVNIFWIVIFTLINRSNLAVPAVRRLELVEVQAVSVVSTSLTSFSLSRELVENTIGCSNCYGELTNILLPLVSIIVPARNEEKNIRRCLLSLLSQNYPNFELIAIDDDSTDNTLEIMNEIKNEIKNIHPKSTIETSNIKLKIVSSTDKPEGWTGKTWASHQGYLHAKGEILLFTDADTCFFDKDAILRVVSHLQTENLDALTGHARIELLDFWSKITMPLWDFFSVILDQNPSAVNNKDSKAAYLVGSLYIIRKTVLEFFGGFNPVRGALKEDVDLGQYIKKAGFKLKIVKMDRLYSALWSRDLVSLWHGIGRTFFGMSTFRVFANLVSLFSLAVLPFLILPYSVFLLHPIGDVGATLRTLGQDNGSINFNGLVQSLVVILNISSCIMITIGTATKDVRKYCISAIYSLLAFPAALFLMFGYIAHLTTLFVPFSRTRKLQWRGRSYSYV